MKLKKLLAGILAAALCCTLASCGDTTWTYRSGDNVVTSGMYVGISMDAASAASSTEGFDASKSPFSQTIEGSDGTKWIQAKAGSLARQYLAIEEKFAEKGLALSEEEQLNITSMVDFYWNTLGLSATYEKEGCGKESYTKIIANTFKRTALFNDLYGEGGEREVPVSELEAAFKNDYVKGIYFAVSAPEGEEADMDQLKKDAERLAKRVEDGEEMEQVKADYQADPDAEGPVEPGDTAVVVRKENATSTAQSAMAKGSVGQVQVVEGEDRYYVVQTLDVMSGDSFEQYRGTILNNMKGDEFEELLTQWANELSVEENTAAVNKHNPKHLKDLYK